MSLEKGELTKKHLIFRKKNYIREKCKLDGIRIEGLRRPQGSVLIEIQKKTAKIEKLRRDLQDTIVKKSQWFERRNCRDEK